MPRCLPWPHPSKLFGVLAVLMACALGPASAAQGADASPFAYAAPEEQGLSSEALSELAGIVAGYVEEGAVVGAELVVIKNRAVVLHEVFGWQDREAGRPLEPNTLFNVRSMTKPLLGSIVQMLIDEGVLALEAPVASYLPAFATEASSAITVEQLLTHRSGLPLSLLTRWGDYADLQEIAAEIGEHGPGFEPGSAFRYSDAGSDALGALVEAATGRPLAEVYRERVLEPLGMAESLVLLGPDDPLGARIASAYMGLPGDWSRFWAPGDPPLYPFAMGSQSLYCTPLDYARFLALWLDGGRLGERRLLSPGAVARALTPVSEMGQPTGFPGLRVDYGQMWVLYRTPDADGARVPVFGHSGSDGTWAWVWPEQDLMVLYFTQSRGQATGIGLEGEIDRLLVHPERVATAAATPAELEPYLGVYTALSGPLRNRPFTVLVQDGKLALDLPEQVVIELQEPDEEGRWYFAIDPRVAISFERDETGAVVQMKLHQAGEIYEVPRGTPPPEAPLDPEAVARYLGTYLDEEAGREIEVVLHNGRLAVGIPESPVPLELFAPDEEGWWYLRANPVVAIRFDEDETGRVVSFTASGPDGQAVRPRVDVGE